MNHNGKLMFEVREKRNGKYYVSVTDGKRGIKEIDADQLKVSSASNFKKLDETYINSKKCELE